MIYRHLLKFMGLLLLLGLPTMGLFAAELRMSAEQLMQLPANANVLIVDARSKEAYAQGHIPNAVNVPFTETFDDIKLSGRVLPLNKAVVLFGQSGVSMGRPVVVYDAGGMFQAARILAILEVFGHQKIQLLDGGLKAWIASQGSITLESTIPTSAVFTPKVNAERFATRLTTLVAVNSPNAFTIIDARNKAHYLGQDSDAKRFGHIPNAIHIDGMENIDPLTGLLKNKHELEKVYAHVPKHKKVIVYCTKGLASSIEYLLLRELGYDVSNYDASWQEWGNDDALPIVTP